MTTVVDPAMDKIFKGTFNMPSPVAVTTIGKLTISTVDLNDAALGQAAYETCVFYPNGNSSVVGRWVSESEALQNHAKIVEHEIGHIVARKKIRMIE
jgi:hypothetical protein